MEVREFSVRAATRAILGKPGGTSLLRVLVFGTLFGLTTTRPEAKRTAV